MNKFEVRIPKSETNAGNSNKQLGINKHHAPFGAFPFPLTLHASRFTPHFRMPLPPLTPSTLYLVSTPIGNLEDITLRALRTLKECDLVAAEDTRRTGHLLKHFGISKPLASYFKWNEAKRSEQILERLR